MHTQNLLATTHTWERHGDFTIKATWSEEGIVENINAIRGGDDNNTRLIIKSVHLSQELIDGLFAFIIRGHATRTALLPNRVNFVDEDNTWLIFTSHLKEFPNSLSTHTHKHLHKIGGGTLNEGDVGFPSNRAREEGLPSPRFPREKGATWDPGTTSKVALRLFEEVHDFFQFILRGVDAFNVTEACFDFLFGDKVFGFQKGITHGARATNATHERSENEKDEREKKND